MLGAGLALGGAALAGGLGGKTTTIREVSAASPTAVAIRPSAALSINDIYRRSAPGVVQVTSTSVVTVPADPFFGGQFFPEQQQQQSLGSGFVVDKAGHVVTNYHVVQGAQADPGQLLERREHEGGRRRHRSRRATSPSSRSTRARAR